MVILKARFRVGHRLKGGNYLIFAKAVQSIKADGLVFLVEILTLILAQVGEHTAVVHVVAVQHQIVGNADVAVFLHIGHPIAAVRLIKSVLQIEIGVILGLHDRIINPGAGNGNPAHQIAVLGVHIRILFKSREFFRLLIRLAGKLQRGQLHIFLDQSGHLLKGFGALFLVQVFTSQHSPGEKEKGGTKSRPRNHQPAFTFVTHISPSCT